MPLPHTNKYQKIVKERWNMGIIFIF